MDYWWNGYSTGNDEKNSTDYNYLFIYFLSFIFCIEKNILKMTYRRIKDKLHKFWSSENRGKTPFKVVQAGYTMVKCQAFVRNSYSVVLQSIIYIQFETCTEINKCLTRHIRGILHVYSLSCVNHRLAEKKIFLLWLK